MKESPELPGAHVVDVDASTGGRAATTTELGLEHRRPGSEHAPMRGERLAAADPERDVRAVAGGEEAAEAGAQVRLRHGEARRLDAELRGPHDGDVAADGEAVAGEVARPLELVVADELVESPRGRPLGLGNLCTLPPDVRDATGSRYEVLGVTNHICPSICKG